MNALPDGWERRPFSELATYRAGRTPARANAAYWSTDSVGVPWVAISDMTEFGTVVETSERITPRAFSDVFRGNAVPKGTLLMSYKLSIGRVATLGVDACHNEAIIAIYPREGVDQRFLGYALAQVDFDELQDRQIKGNTLNQEKIDRIPILLPPGPEQTRIADVLDLVRRGICLEAEQVDLAEALKRAVMRELFTRGLRGEAQKETEIGPIPESWNQKPLGEVFRLTSGKTRPTELSPTMTLTKPFPVWGGNGVMGYSDQWFVDANETLIIGRVGEYCGAVHTAKGKCWITDNALYAREWLDQAVTTPFAAEFLRYFDLNRFRRTAGQPLVTQGLINEHSMPLPSAAEEQREIVGILDAIDRKIALHKEKHGVLEALFKSLLHKLMTGEVRIADFNLDALGGKAEAA